MQICKVCGAQENNGNISLDFDRKRRVEVSNKDMHYTKCCQHAIARGGIECLNRNAQLLDIPFLR